VKKLLMVFLIVLLSACSAKTLKWEEVKENYIELENVSANTAAPEAFMKSDYLKIFDELKEELNTLQKGIEKDAEDNAIAIYNNALSLEKLVSEKDNEDANTLKDLAYGLKKVVEAAYEKSEDFDSLKNALLEQVDEIREWSDDRWNLVELRARMKWSAVESEYEAMKEEILAELKEPSEVTEYDLEELKDTILNNYEVLSEGVNESNKAQADLVYRSAAALYEYTKELEEESGIKVASFAKQAMEYVEEMYGVKITDPDYNFNTSAAAAKKFSLSTWNEITTELKINRW